MPSGSPFPSRLARPFLWAVACAMAPVLWSAVAWVGLRPHLQDLHILAVPMAPWSAVSVALLGTALLLAAQPPEARTWRLVTLACGCAMALPLAVLVAHALGGSFPLERWVVAEPILVHDLIRQEVKVLGRMSPVTAWALLTLAPVPLLLRRHRQTAALLALGILAFSLFLLLGFVMGTAVLHRQGLSPTAFLSDLALLSLGLGGLCAAGTGVYPLKLFRMEGSPGLPPRFSQGALGAFLGIALLVFASAAFFLRAQRRAIQDAARQELATIADLKTRQIAQWLRERRGDTEVLSRAATARDALAPGADRSDLLTRWLDLYRTQYAYRAVALYDAHGRLRLASPADLAGPPPPASQGVVFEDFRWDPAEGRVVLGFRAPVRDRDGIRMLGALRLLVDPEDYLYPLLRDWPTASRTAESLLARREGDRVINLSALRHRSDAILRLPFRLEERPDLPAVQAAQGRLGEFQARDYRGTPVLASARQVPGSPWLLIAKIDQSEVLAPLRTRGQATALLGLAILALAALALSLQVHSGELHHMARHLELEREAKTMAERFHHLMREANDLVLLAGPNQEVLEANRMAESRYGPLQGRRLPDLLAPEAGAEAEEGMAALASAGAARFETLHRDAAGASFPVALSLRRVEIDGSTYLLALGRDITERRARERELERLSRLYATLSQVNQALVRAGSCEDLFREVCRVLVAVGGFPHAWIAWLAEDGTVQVRAKHGGPLGLLNAFPAPLGDGSAAQGPSRKAIREDRTVICSDLNPDSGLASLGAFPIHLEGKVCGALLVGSREKDLFQAREVALLEEAATDISFSLAHLEEVASRTRAEAELRLQMERMHLAAASAQLGIWEMDLLQGRGQLDARMAEIYGLPGPAELPLEAWQDFVHPEERDWVLSSLRQKTREGSALSMTFRILRPDGQTRVLRADGIFLKDAQGRLARAVGLARDLTDELRQEEERRSLQIQLHQAQKLESLGILAGGVAHDMNNVLGAILSRASTEREHVAPESPVARSLDVIINACMRGRGVVKGLLCFARRELEEDRPVDLNALARELVQLLAYTTLKRVELVMELQEPLPQVHGDAGALSHAVMNLCVNSVDAMPFGGTLTLRTCTLPDGRVQLSVRDTGEGMTPEVQEKALEPFFTTKPAGRGTGLGLSMVFGTVKAHGGTMALESETGRGTEVFLRFPAAPEAEAPVVASPAAPPAEAPAPVKPLHVLLVDDDELIRDSVGPMLESLGHRVELASSGLEALRMLEGGLTVDLVILDMNMPGLNGAETLPRILALRPGQAVLMSTGYSDQDIRHLLSDHASVSILRKPFTLKELRNKLAALAV